MPVLNYSWSWPSPAPYTPPPPPPPSNQLVESDWQVYTAAPRRARSLYLPDGLEEILVADAILFVNSSYTTSGTSSCNATLPPGVVDGDFMIATVLTDSATPQGTSGFTQQATGNQGGGPAYVSTKIASSQGSTIPFGGGAGSYCTVMIDAYRLVDSTTPMDVAATVATGAGANVAFPSITTVTGRAFHYAVYVDAGTTDSAKPVGYRERQNHHPTELHAYDRSIVTAGAVSGVQTTGGGTGWVAFSLALRPASESGGGDPQILWSAHMEGGNLTEWDDEVNTGVADTTVVTSSVGVTPHGGTYMMLQSVTGTGGTRMSIYQLLVDLARAGTPFYYTFWHYMPALITFGISDTYIIWGTVSKLDTPTAPAPWWDLVLHQSGGTMDLVYSPNNQAADPGPHSGESGGRRVYNGTTVIPIGQWNKFEIYVNPKSGYTGQIKVWINGVVEFDQSSVKTIFPDIGQALLLYTEQTGYGSGLSPSPAKAYVDDVTVSLGRMP